MSVSTMTVSVNDLRALAAVELTVPEQVGHVSLMETREMRNETNSGRSAALARASSRADISWALRGISNAKVAAADRPRAVIERELIFMAWFLE